MNRFQQRWELNEGHVDGAAGEAYGGIVNTSGVRRAASSTRCLFRHATTAASCESRWRRVVDDEQFCARVRLVAALVLRRCECMHRMVDIATSLHVACCAHVVAL